MIVYKQSNTWTREKLDGNLTHVSSWCTDQILHSHLHQERRAPSPECTPIRSPLRISSSQRELLCWGTDVAMQRHGFFFNRRQIWRAIPASRMSHGIIWGHYCDYWAGQPLPSPSPASLTPLKVLCQRALPNKTLAVTSLFPQELNSWHLGNEIYRVESWIWY